jgi:hypothetical protein
LTKGLNGLGNSAMDDSVKKQYNTTTRGAARESTGHSAKLRGNIHSLSTWNAGR